MHEISIKTKTMSSVDLLSMINKAREQCGEPSIRLNDFVARCKDELDGEHYESFVVQNSNKTVSTHLNLTKDQCLLVSMRESKAVRRRVVAILNADSAKSFSIPQNLPEVLRLAADQAETIERQQLLIEQQKPAVEFLDRFVEAKSDKGLREVAKILGIKEREFIATLERDQIVFRQGSNILPFAHYQHAGYFTVKTGEANGHAFIQSRFTPSGVAWIAKRFVK